MPKHVLVYCPECWFHELVGRMQCPRLSDGAVGLCFYFLSALRRTYDSQSSFQGHLEVMLKKQKDMRIELRLLGISSMKSLGPSKPDSWPTVPVLMPSVGTTISCALRIANHSRYISGAGHLLPLQPGISEAARKMIGKNRQERVGI